VPKPIYAKNKVGLAAAINISRPALYRLMTRPDRPELVAGKGWNIVQWQRYANDNVAFYNQRKRQEPRSRNERDDAYIERQRIEAEKAQFDLDVKRNKFELKSAMIERVMTNWNFFIRELDKALRHELPPRLEGMSAGQIAKLLGSRLDNLRERTAKAIESRNGTGPTLA
jgi:hypothetical protein